jgi:hypothetical protein
LNVFVQALQHGRLRALRGHAPPNLLSQSPNYEWVIRNDPVHTQIHERLRSIQVVHLKILSNWALKIVCMAYRPGNDRKAKSVCFVDHFFVRKQARAGHGTCGRGEGCDLDGFGRLSNTREDDTSRETIEVDASEEGEDSVSVSSRSQPGQLETSVCT